MSVFRIMALALAGVIGMPAMIIGTPQPAFRRLYTLNPTGTVEIQNAYGDVSITAWDRDEVLVEAVKKSSDPRNLEDARIIVDSSYDSLSVRTLYAGDGTGGLARVEYRIKVPRAANLERVKLTNGGLSLRGLAGRVRASAVNGRIRAEQMAGLVELSTVNGGLDADFERVAGSGSISLSSVNGPIRLALPRASAAVVAVLNVSGGIDSDLGRPCHAGDGNHLRAVLNRGGVQIQVRNVNGGISIRGLWHGRGERPWS
jgi:DUF4097 and DUF4098 domain-containing protein YvlB